MATIWIPDESTWPQNVVEFLDVNGAMFIGWHNRKKDDTPFTEAKHRAEVAEAQQFDQAIYELSNQLRSHSLRDYHCTRLTDQEIMEIKANGMGLPCPEMLNRRIAALVRSGDLSSAEAVRLSAKNQADEEYRRNRIWFCFYEPKFAGQGGIEDLLRHWGGEALYNSHDSDEEMGPVLRRIGTPCVVEADAPITSLSSVNDLSLDVARIYAKRKGANTGGKPRFEACVLEPLSAPTVNRIVRFHDSDFASLTGCNEWTPPLTP
jgi:hypothetical protein